MIREASRDKLVADDPYVQTYRPRSILVVPILHQADLTGILYFENNAASGAFTESRLKVLHLLASQAAISIENARLYADMEERVSERATAFKTLSLQDSLTGVPNRRALDERLIEEIGRSRRSDLPFALLMIDIDNFKYINDSFGHPTGDICLQRIGATLQAQCRHGTEFVARYGGDEFLMILPNTDGNGAHALAEQVRLAVQGVVLEVGDVRHPITVSIGIANYDAYMLPDASSLIDDADRNLYAAKAAGRNCVLGDGASAAINSALDSTATR